MSRRGQRSAPSGERFFTRLREALARFEDGVHSLGPAASEAALNEAAARLGHALPPSLAELYRFADGMWLFDDLVRVRSLAELAPAAPKGWLHVGQLEGETLLSDPRGALYEEDEDGDRLRLAEDLEEALLAAIARESLLVDAMGEWKDVFDEGGELRGSVRKRRNEAARRRSPRSARWWLEAAELALELDGDEDQALELLAEAVALDEGAAAPCELRGLLLAARGGVAEGARSLAAAAERSGASRKAERAATAAEAAARAGDEPERSRLAELARAAEPGLALRLAGEAEVALEGGRLDDADRLSGLAVAVAGGDAGLSPRLRGRIRLRIPGPRGR